MEGDIVYVWINEKLTDEEAAAIVALIDLKFGEAHADNPRPMGC